MKRVVSVNDLSGTGRCSLYVAISIMSALGVSCVPLPTAILSNQTGVAGFSFLDFTDQMKPYLSAWEKQGQVFDNIHTGFLTGKSQLKLIMEFIDRFASRDANIVIDPVMADDGELYPVYDMEYAQMMRELCKKATILTPNVTELFFLANSSSRDTSREGLISLMEKIKSQKTREIFVTGVVAGDKIKTIYYNCTSKVYKEIVSSYNGKSYSGTGDIFSSIISALVARGKDSLFAAEKAAEFISMVAKETQKQNGDTREGILFEEHLKELTKID